MGRIRLVLALAAVMVAMLLFVGGPATADDVDVEDVFVNGDEVCVVLEIEEEDDGGVADVGDDDDDDDDEEVDIECENIA